MQHTVGKGCVAVPLIHYLTVVSHSESPRVAVLGNFESLHDYQQPLIILLPPHKNAARQIKYVIASPGRWPALVSFSCGCSQTNIHR